MFTCPAGLSLGSGSRRRGHGTDLSEPVKVKVPPGSKAEGKLRLKDKGLPSAAGGHGDLFLNLQIVVPPTVTEEERALYQRLAKGTHPDPRAELLRQRKPE